MTLWRVNLIASSIALLFGIVFVIYSIPIYSVKIGGGPGVGLFPFWIGIVVIFCGLLYLRQSLKSGSSERFFSIGSQKGTFLQCALSIIAYIGIMPYLGFAFSSLLVLFFHLRVIGGCRLFFSFWFSCIAVGLLAFCFKVLLYLPLPRGPFGW